MKMCVLRVSCVSANGAWQGRRGVDFMFGKSSDPTICSFSLFSQLEPPMPLRGLERGTPCVRCPAEPTNVGRDWTSRYCGYLDSYSTRIAPSPRQHRDGTYKDRSERMQHTDRVLGVSQDAVMASRQAAKNASPRLATDDQQAFGRKRKEEPLSLKWTNEPTWTTTTNQFFPNPADVAADPVALYATRPARYSSLQPHRVTPSMWATLQMKSEYEPIDSPKRMPQAARVSTRGGAHVPTRGDWAEPETLRAPSPRLPLSARNSEEGYKLELAQARIRSEQRVAHAALATALELQQRGALMSSARPYTNASGALSAR